MAAVRARFEEDVVEVLQKGWSQYHRRSCSDGSTDPLLHFFVAISPPSPPSATGERASRRTSFPYTSADFPPCDQSRARACSPSVGRHFVGRR